MPSQEEYLDNLLKGIETENTETEVTKEPKMTGTEEELSLIHISEPTRRS